MKPAKKPIAWPLKRREVLNFLSGTAAVSLFGCLRQPAASGEATSQPLQLPNQLPNQPQVISASPPRCIVKPQQTAGPYFVDHRLDRADIRSDSTTGAAKPGIPLRLVFQVSQIQGQSCTPLPGAMVDVWHCDASGVYSDVADPGFSTIGQTFLRGYQVTNANGNAEFVTIYPGAYPGRTVHIHFKIRVAGATSSEFTSQLYFDDAVTDRIHAQPPYTARSQRNQRNAGDGIFRDGGEQLLVQLAPIANGYVGTFAIGLQLA